jgi:hypothetical protein
VRIADRELSFVDVEIEVSSLVLVWHEETDAEVGISARDEKGTHVTALPLLLPSLLSLGDNVVSIVAITRQSYLIFVLF